MKKEKSEYRGTTKALWYVVFGLFTVVILMPILWSISTSFKPDHELVTWPIKIFPVQWDFLNYIEAIKQAHLFSALFNSTVVTIIRIITSIFFCSMTGYVFARLSFPGKKIIFGFLLMTMMVPIQASLVPIFILIKSVPFIGGNNIYGQGGSGLLNSHLGLSIPAAITVYGVFLFRQYFSTLPKELEDAAHIDGCSEWDIYWRIMLPQTKPAQSTLAMLSFLWSWNDFMWPLVCVRSDNMKTVQLSLSVFQQEYITNWAPLMAAIVVITIPSLVVFLFLQRFYVRGIAFSGIKG